MAARKKDKVELRYYDIPQKEGVLALTGDEWIREYGEGIDNLHFHNLLEIGICRFGTGDLVLDQRAERFGPDMISVIPRNFPHTTNSDPGTYGSWEYLFLDPGTLLREHFGENEILQRRFLNLLGRDAFFGPVSQYRSLSSVVELILDEMRTKGAFYIEKVRGLLLSLLFEIARIAKKEDEDEPDVQLRTGVGPIQNALKYVEEHYADPIRIEELAKECHISETHFRRLFSEYIDMTPVEYVNLVRVLRSCEALRSSNASMSTVAQNCGFSTVSTFDRNFKQVLGVTPYQWKKDPKNYESRLLEVNVSVRKGW
jgi:AraC-like DNA-binding protein